MILHATSRPAADATAEPHHFDVEAGTYEDAFAQAQASLPEGWLLMHVLRD